MVSRKLVSYVESRLEKGFSEADIIAKLKKAGASSSSVDAALVKAHRDLKNRKVPRPKFSQPKSLGEALEAVRKYSTYSLSRKMKRERIIKNLLDVGWKQEQIMPILREVERQLNLAEEKSIEKMRLEKQMSSAHESPEARIILLKNYVQSSLAKGIAKDNVRQIVLRSGWSEEQLDKVLDELGGQPEKIEHIESKIDEAHIRSNPDIKIKDEYMFRFRDMEVRVILYIEKGKPNMRYHMIIPVISQTTDLILEEIRLKLIDQLSLGTLEVADQDFDKLDKRVQEFLVKLVEESFSQVDKATQKFLASYLISKVLGLGIIEIIKSDENLEEVVINKSADPVYVYHKKWGWCLTNQYLRDDDQIIHLAAMTGRKIGREITTLNPLLDAHLPNGDRVNATLKPVTVEGPTVTIRKFSNDPWTITKFLKTKTMTYETAALLWLAIQYELSCLIVGGTASGKTSCLNVLTQLIPPNQRVISIEDTRELKLPKYMHWIPMIARQPNPEGKGAVEMEDLLVNSLRMRPDRIIVGEVRKRVQAETLFEAIHTGHSCYATFHANNADEALIRLTNPPVSVPKSMMPAISLLVVQFRNRRTGLRRTFQIAEISKTGDINIIYQYNPRTDDMSMLNKSTTLFETLELYTGNSEEELQKMIVEKVKVLKYMVEKKLESIEDVGRVMSMYYADHDAFMKTIG